MTLHEQIKNIWAELRAFGHEPTGVNLGIWSGPRQHQVHFLSRHRVVETVDLFIASAEEFDTGRELAHALPHGDKNIS